MLATETAAQELKLIGDITETLLSEVASIKHRTESLFSPLETDLVALTVLEDLNHSADRMKEQVMRALRLIDGLEKRHNEPRTALEVAS